MIPKIIHYCWFGNKPLSELNLKCIESWKKHNPEFEIKRWDESNYELKNDFVREAYSYKKFAFVADYCRLETLYKYGGIYLDTDMMVLKSLTPLLENDIFFGFEPSYYVSAGIIGSISKNNHIKNLMNFYINNHFRPNKYLTIPKIISKYLNIEPSKVVKDEIIIYQDIKIYPPEYYYPLPYNENPINYSSFITNKSYTVHFWDKSWYNEIELIRQNKILDSLRYIFTERKNEPIYKINYYFILIGEYLIATYRIIKNQLKQFLDKN